MSGFKSYLLHSNLWFVKGLDFKSNSMFFENAKIVVNEQLVLQKTFIWDQFQQLMQNKMMFNKLADFGLNYGHKAKSNDNSPTVLRQDSIRNGILPNSNEFDMLLIGIKTEKAATGFNVEYENNTKVYLTQCLQFAHLNNGVFQQEMAKYFLNTFGKNCKYQSAPVKVYNRCVVKATSVFKPTDCSLSVINNPLFAETSSQEKNIENFVIKVDVLKNMKNQRQRISFK